MSLSRLSKALIGLTTLKNELIRSREQSSTPDGRLLETYEEEIDISINEIRSLFALRDDMIPVKNSDETYLDLLSDVLDAGRTHHNRTGVSTRSVFGRQVKFDLSNEFPILTTKRVWWKGVVHELLWMLSGSTNIQPLKREGVNIWNEWADEHGELGPVYGAQWRSWIDTEPHALVNIDQIADLMEGLQNNPGSRRHIVTAWNPAEIDDMALPPCHLLFQMKVDEFYNTLHCHMYQRSADLFLGVPFNIASYALLTHMIARTLGFFAGTLTISFGDVHIYENHVEQVMKQLKRLPTEKRPQIEIARKLSIFDYKPEDLVLKGYDPHPAIKGDVAV